MFYGFNIDKKNEVELTCHKEWLIPPRVLSCICNKFIPICHRIPGEFSLSAYIIDEEEEGEGEEEKKEPQIYVYALRSLNGRNIDSQDEGTLHMFYDSYLQEYDFIFLGQKCETCGNVVYLCTCPSARTRVPYFYTVDPARVFSGNLKDTKDSDEIIKTCARFCQFLADFAQGGENDNEEYQRKLGYIITYIEGFISSVENWEGSYAVREALTSVPCALLACPMNRENKKKFAKLVAGNEDKLSSHGIYNILVYSISQDDWVEMIDKDRDSILGRVDDRRVFHYGSPRHRLCDALERIHGLDKDLAARLVDYYPILLDKEGTKYDPVEVIKIRGEVGPYPIPSRVMRTIWSRRRDDTFASSTLWRIVNQLVSLSPLTALYGCIWATETERVGAFDYSLDKPDFFIEQFLAHTEVDVRERFWKELMNDYGVCRDIDSSLDARATYEILTNVLVDYGAHMVVASVNNSTKSLRQTMQEHVAMLLELMPPDAKGDFARNILLSANDIYNYDDMMPFIKFLMREYIIHAQSLDGSVFLVVLEEKLTKEHTRQEVIKEIWKHGGNKPIIRRALASYIKDYGKSAVPQEVLKKLQKSKDRVVQDRLQAALTEGFVGYWPMLEGEG